MNWLNQRDKQMHFAGGFLAAFFIALFFGRFAAFASATAIGFIKEELDRRDPLNHTEEARDAFATSLGAFIGAIIGDALKPILWSLLSL